MLHCARVDATTLSPECQQPSQPNLNRVARALESVAPQRFSQHREHSKEVFWIRAPGPSRQPPRIRQLEYMGSPTLRQGSDAMITPARPATPSGRACHQPSKRQRTNRDEIEQRSLAGRSRRTLSPECQQPSHQSVSNPVKNPVRNPPTAGQRQPPRTRAPPPRRRHPKEENIEMTLC